SAYAVGSRSSVTAICSLGLRPNTATTKIRRRRPSSDRAVTVFGRAAVDVVTYPTWGRWLTGTFSLVIERPHRLGVVFRHAGGEHSPQQSSGWAVVGRF